MFMLEKKERNVLRISLFFICTFFNKIELNEGRFLASIDMRVHIRVFNLMKKDILTKAHNTKFNFELFKITNL